MSGGIHGIRSKQKWAAPNWRQERHEGAQPDGIRRGAPLAERKSDLALAQLPIRSFVWFWFYSSGAYALRTSRCRFGEDPSKNSFKDAWEEDRLPRDIVWIMLHWYSEHSPFIRVWLVLSIFSYSTVILNSVLLLRQQIELLIQNCCTNINWKLKHSTVRSQTSFY